MAIWVSLGARKLRPASTRADNFSSPTTQNCARSCRAGVYNHPKPMNRWEVGVSFDRSSHQPPTNAPTLLLPVLTFKLNIHIGTLPILPTSPFLASFSPNSGAKSADHR